MIYSHNASFYTIAKSDDVFFFWLSMAKNKLDPIDLRIIEEMTANARIPLIQLAKKLKVSNTLVHQRIRKISDLGILEQATFHINPLAMGYETSVYTQIMLNNSKDIKKVVDQLRMIPEIVECVNIAGRYALLVRIYAENNRALRDIIYGKIQSLEEVEGTNTTFSFETAFSRNIPIELKNN